MSLLPDARTSAPPAGAVGRRLGLRGVGFVAMFGLAVGGSVPTGCGPGEEAPFRVEVRFSPTPPLVGTARTIVTVHDPAGSPVTGASVEVSATAGGGVGAPAFTAAEDGDGRYVVAALPFSGPGEWTVRVSVRTEDGRAGNTDRRIQVSGRP